MYIIDRSKARIDSFGIWKFKFCFECNTHTEAKRNAYIYMYVVRE